MKYLYIIIALLFLFGFSGCIDLTRTYPDRNYYSINVIRPESEHSTQFSGIVKVLPFSISSTYEGRQLVYRTDQTSFSPDYYHQFLTTPAAIITQQTQEWLMQSNIFDSAITHRSTLDAIYVLEGHIVALYGDYRDPSQPKAIMDIYLFLIKEHGNQITLQKDYHQEVVLASKSASDLVIGFQSALANIMTQFESDLRTNLVPEK